MASQDTLVTRPLHRTRSIRWFMVVVGLIAAFTVLAPTASASSHRNRDFHLEKVCSGFTCTVTASSDRRIPAGTIISYAGDSPAALAATINVKHGAITGRCDISAVFGGTGPGTCAFAGGTGSLRDFRITLDVTFDGTVWFWDGTFRRHHCGHHR
jgi:hypothetical protein